MKNSSNIICFAPSDWWGMNPSCTTHIMRHFSAANKVLYVNPFSSDIFGGKSGAARKGLKARIIRKLRSMLKCLRRPEKNIYVFSPFFIPIQGKRIFDIINNFLLVIQLGMVSRIIRLKRPIVWVENIRAADLLKVMRPSLIIYHVSDLFTADQYSSDANIRYQWDKSITNKSDLIICVSRQLYEAKKKVKGNVHYLPHGVDYDRYRKAATTSEISEPIKDVTHPIAGYFGTMTALNDIELLHHCATSLPQISFVLAGQVTSGDYQELGKLPNVYLLGRVPYKNIPTLCANFDVCMLQWKMDDWIRACNPLKMFEYMASGKPIVSVPIEEVKKYDDLISITETKEEFCRAIEWELQNDTPERAQKRIDIARQNSWASHMETINDLITHTFDQKYKQE